MNLRLIIIAAFIAIAMASPRLKDRPKLRPCDEPAVYCRSLILQEKCNKKEFCENWRGDGVEAIPIDIWKYYWSDVSDFLGNAGSAISSTA